MILNTTENITIEHRSLYEFCNDDEQCNRVRYQNGCDNPDVQAMHDDENGEPIKVKIHGMEDGDKAEVEIEKSSDSSDEEENKNNEEEIRNMNAAKNVPVYQDNSKAADTYYVRMSDTRRFMEEVDMSITEALDSIIEANAASSVDADNLFLVVEASDNMDESTIERLKSFGINVINYDSVKESLDTSSIEEEVNPIMAMKRNPATIAIANVNEHYYVAGADLVNYMEAAEIDNAIEALNNIIEAHADSDIDADNICVVMDEASEALEDVFEESDVKIHEAFGSKTPTKVTAEDAKKVSAMLKSILRKFDIDTVRKTVEIRDVSKVEKDIKKGKNPVLALYRPLTDTTVSSSGDTYRKIDKKVNPSKAELDLLIDDLNEAMEKENLNYTASWKMTMFGKGLIIK